MSMEFDAAGDANAVRKVMPHSFRKCPNLVIGFVIHIILFTNFSAIINSANTIPIIINGTTRNG